MTNIYDCVIVGGGNLGLWTAYHLVQRRQLRVAICERHHAGSGATSRSAGMIRQQGGTVTAIRLGIRSRQLYLQLGEELKLDSGFHQTGYYVLAESEKQKQKFAQLVALRQACGLENEWLGPQEASRRFPALNWDLLLGATFTANDGYVNPAVVIRNITLGILRTGMVDLLECCPVQQIEPVGDTYRVHTPHGILQSPWLVNTAGPRGFQNVGHFLNIDSLPVTASRHQIVTFPRVEAMASDPWPMALALERGFYIRPHEYGILLGMTNPDEPEDDSDRYQLEFDWDYYEKLCPQWEALVPALAGLPISQAWAAAVDRTPDNLPILDAPWPGFFVLSAGSHGMMNGPALAEKLAERMLENRLTDIPGDEVGLDRFLQPLKRDPICLSPKHKHMP
jgi:sarcosine oxidase, subunit beta